MMSVMMSLGTTCEIIRPFGSGTVVASGVIGRLVPDLRRGRRDGLLSWTDYIDLDSSVDVRDGCSRTAAAPTLVYADGDELRIPNSLGSRYVVVWVEWHNRGTSQAFKRAYLVRDTAVWPGP